ncbi:MAG: DNA translocase FtsK, partial [Bacillota bacterium]
RFLAGRTRDELNRKARLLESTLESFGVRGKVMEISHGPTITRFDIHPGPGVKVSQIVNLADDISLSLATSGVRVVAPVPGKSVVGIEVPNRKVSSVLLREILESREFKRSTDPLTLALGSDITGRPVVVRLADLLHLLIAGATGSGKSICIRCIIGSILFKARPDEVKLILIDPKVVEFMSYTDLPHLLTPVVTDSRKAAGCLTWAVKEMERRYTEFASKGVRDIGSYNRRARESGDEPQPRIVIIIDELADLMMVARVDVEDAIQRLAQMARAAGIHLVVATQRPSVDVITGVIKANIPSRLAFAVSSGADSRTILDSSGAERLMGNGDMLLSPVGRDKAMRAQGSYLSDEDLDKLLKWVRRHGAPDYQEEVMAAQVESAEGDADEGDDPKVDEAIEVVLQNGEASVSMLQRKLRVGYTRAGRLIDILENMGVVGPHQGPKPREVLITRAQYRQQREERSETEPPPAEGC